MLRFYSCLAAGLAFASTAVAQGNYSFITELGEMYSYAVHQPLNWQNTTSPPPAMLYLGGTGSKFVDGVTEGIERVVSFGGPGWRIDRYYNGSREEADVLAVEQFLTIIPVYAEELPSHEWDIDATYAVLANARSKFDWDDSRLYLSTFSMGARTAWPLLIANSTLFAAASIAAGVPVLDVESRTPDINYTGMDVLSSIPIMQFAGRQDYENASQVWEHQAVQNHLQDELGFTNVQLSIEEDAMHGDMQQAPFTADLFYFFLNQTGNATAETLVGPSGAVATEIAVSTDSAGQPMATATPGSVLADTESSASNLVFGSAAAAGIMALAGLCVAW